MMSFQLGRPLTLVTLVLGAALGVAAAVLDTGLLAERPADAADMDDNNVESTVQSKHTYIGASTAYQWLC
jgi:hypothetical protein